MQDHSQKKNEKCCGRAGLKPEREVELLGKWRAQSQGNP
jgi:hypothetical protein